MTLSWTLSRYLSLQFLTGVGIILAVLIGLTYLIDVVEMLRNIVGKGRAPFSAALMMSLFKLPHLTQKILPFAFMFGAMLSLTRLTKNHELVVVRAAGLSVWQFLGPAILIAALSGIFIVTIYDQASSSLFSQFERLQTRYNTGKSSFLQVSTEGLWLRQGDQNKQSVIHATGVQASGTELQNVIIFLYESGDKWVGRIDAKSATLKNGYWDISEATITTLDKASEFQHAYRLDTTLTLAQILDSFASPDTISFWDLPGFIKMAEEAGFSARRHRLHWHSILSTPILLCAMVLIAAAVSLRFTRLGGISKMLIAGVLAGFVLYFVADVSFALGLSGSLPVPLAAWAPTFIALLLGLTTLFHLEDG